MRNAHAYFCSTFRFHHLSYSFHLGVLLHSAPQILDLAAGIEASNQPFLWILRSPDAPMVTHDYDGALPALEFLPQVSLLAHSTTPFRIRGHTTHKLIN